MICDRKEVALSKAMKKRISAVPQYFYQSEHRTDRSKKHKKSFDKAILYLARNVINQFQVAGFFSLSVRSNQDQFITI